MEYVVKIISEILDTAGQEALSLKNIMQPFRRKWQSKMMDERISIMRDVPYRYT